MLYYIKIIVLFGIAVLLGQIIYITYNTSMYLDRGQIQLEAPQETLQASQPIVEVVEVYIQDWKDFPAEKLKTQ